MTVHRSTILLDGTFCYFSSDRADCSAQDDLFREHNGLGLYT